MNSSTLRTPPHLLTERELLTLAYTRRRERTDYTRVYKGVRPERLTPEQIHRLREESAERMSKLRAQK